jgi:hypothetical protein
MEITLDEALLHLSGWREQKLCILAQHGTRNWQNNTFVRCYVSDLDGRLALANEDDPGQFDATFTFENVRWSYLEIWERGNYPEHLRSLYKPDTPILVLAWPEMEELLILQPLPDELQAD